jgi:transposase InsO family protein
LSEKGFQYLLTFQDNFSKFVGAIPVENLESQTIAENFVRHIVCNFGLPEVILTDQGTNFTSALFKNMCKMFKIKKIQTSAYHPQSNGGLERFHRSMKEFFRAFVNDEQSDWDEKAHLACFAYNTSVHASTGFTPFEIMMGREIEIPSGLKESPKPFYAYGDYVLELKEKMKRVNEEVRDNVISSKEKVVEGYNKNKKDKDFEVGETVKLKSESVRRGRSKKLGEQFLGPYIVTDVISDSNIKIKKGRREEVVHKDRVERYY